ncbi:MAG TPA: hypothetical protein PKJ41_01160 [Bryobacteraceae bacterium]|nr:hypothetical protein [Bryobacteraceae bacterium]
MNCQYCGKKIGILENWRYGRFCLKEHQDEFREEAGRLAASVLGSQIGAPSMARTQGGDNPSLFAKPAQTAAGDPLEPPAPPRMEAVAQDLPTAVRCKPPEPPPPPPPAGERDQRCLKILASIDRVPPALEKDSRRRLAFDDKPFPFGTLMAKGSRNVLVPPSGAVQRRPKLALVDSLLPLRYDEKGGPLPEFEPAWQSEAAWDAETTAPVAMEFGEHIDDYAIEQPWQEWDWDALLEEAKYFQAQAEQRERQRGELRSQKAQERAGEGPAGQPASRPRYQPMPGHSSLGRTQAPAALPPSGLAPAGLTGQGSQKPRPPAQPAPAPHASGPGGMFLPAMPAYPGTSALRPVPSGSSAAAGTAGRAFPSGLMPVGRIGSAHGDHSHVEWVELSPPLFLALCKIEDPPVLRANTQPVKPPCRTVHTFAEPISPAGGRTLAVAPARMTPGLQLLFPIEPAPPASPEPLRLTAPAEPQPAAAKLSIPLRPAGKPRLALPRPTAKQRIVLDLRPLPPLEPPHFVSRIAG